MHRKEAGSAVLPSDESSVPCGPGFQGLAEQEVRLLSHMECLHMVPSTHQTRMDGCSSCWMFFVLLLPVRSTEWTWCLFHCCVPGTTTDQSPRWSRRAWVPRLCFRLSAEHHHTDVRTLGKEANCTRTLEGDIEGLHSFKTLLPCNLVKAREIIFNSIYFTDGL